MSSPGGNHIKLRAPDRAGQVVGNLRARQAQKLGLPKKAIDGLVGRVRQVAKTILPLLKQPQLVYHVAELLKGVKERVKQWAPLLTRFLKSEDDQVEMLLTLEE